MVEAGFSVNIFFLDSFYFVFYLIVFDDKSGRIKPDGYTCANRSTKSI